MYITYLGAKIVSLATRGLVLLPFPALGNDKKFQGFVHARHLHASSSSGRMREV